MTMWKHKLAILAIVILVASIVCYGVSSIKASVADTNIPDNEVASSANETDNSARATITIT